ncbi:MAG: class I SAM-dependent methyltransferase [Candidatus Dormibacteria bacterium]
MASRSGGGSTDTGSPGQPALPPGVARQERYRGSYRRRRPGWQDSQSLHRDLLDRHLTAETRVLDVGCGHADFLAVVYARSHFIYGIDPDPVALARNRAVSHVVHGRAEVLPWPDGHFDLVVMAWVAEHLDNPAAVAREIHRVLRPGGRFLFLTPNAWNYNAWLVRMVPNRFHHHFTSRLYGRQERATYPVRYRMNTPWRRSGSSVEPASAGCS